jgi:filamentous hemagglutinin
MRSLAALLLFVGVARAEDPSVQFGALKLEPATVGDAAGWRAAAPVSSDGLVGRMCLVRFHLQQGDKAWQESRKLAVSVAQWEETTFYQRAFLSSTFDVKKPIDVTFQLVDVVSQRELGTISATLPAQADPNLVLADVAVESYRKVVYRGPVDLRPTWARIQRGEHYPHRTDGGVFHDREHRLPKHDGDYYREYVHPTPGLRGAGPQRLIVGRGGEIFYTPNHYRSFIRIQ